MSQNSRILCIFHIWQIYRVLIPSDAHSNTCTHGLVPFRANKANILYHEISQGLQYPQKGESNQENSRIMAHFEAYIIFHMVYLHKWIVWMIV